MSFRKVTFMSEQLTEFLKILDVIPKYFWNEFSFDFNIVCELLNLDHNVKKLIHTCDMLGESFLMNLSRCCKDEHIIIKMLSNPEILENIDKQNKRGCTIPMILIEYNNSETIIDYMLNIPEVLTTFHIKDLEGWNIPLYLNKFCNHENILLKMLDIPEVIDIIRNENDITIPTSDVLRKYRDCTGMNNKTVLINFIDNPETLNIINNENLTHHTIAMMLSRYCKSERVLLKMLSMDVVLKNINAYDENKDETFDKCNAAMLLSMYCKHESVLLRMLDIPEIVQNINAENSCGINTPMYLGMYCKHENVLLKLLSINDVIKNINKPDSYNWTLAMTISNNCNNEKVLLKLLEIDSVIENIHVQHGNHSVYMLLKMQYPNIDEILKNIKQT